jgi:uncharacterized membrane protein YkvI
LGREFLRSAAVYVGTLIGAGFASGQELVGFFACFGLWGLAGACLAGAALGLGGWLIMWCARTSRATSLRELLASVPRPLDRALALVISAFLFSGLTIMLSAGGTLLEGQIRLPRFAGIPLMAALTLAACWWRTEGLGRVNTLAAPLLIGTVAATGLIHLSRLSAFPSGTDRIPVAPHWWWAAGLYAGYNLLAGAAILPAFAHGGPGAGRGALAGGLAVGAVAALCVPALNSYLDQELPLLAAARSLGAMWAWAYTANLGLALWTTAAGHLFGLAANARAYRPRLIVLLLLAIPPAHLPFSALVGSLYPLFGYLGAVLMLCLALWRPRCAGRC